MDSEFEITRYSRVIRWRNIASMLFFFAVTFYLNSAHAKSRVEAPLPELVALLTELSPQDCFQIEPFVQRASARAEVVRFGITSPHSAEISEWESVDLRQSRVLGTQRLPSGARILFSPWRALNAVTLLADRMSELEPLCAHSIEKRTAMIERRLMGLISRIELSTQELATKEKALVAFDVETVGVVEGLDLPLAGLMAQSPKGLPSPAQFGRELGKLRKMNIAAIIHARGGDLAQPRAASRDLNIPLVVLDLDKEIPSSLSFSQYLEEFYRAVLNGLGVRLILKEEREN